MQKLTNKKRKGFTLVEIIIVVIIIGILAALIVPRFTNATDQARVTAALAEHRSAISEVMLQLAAGKEAEDAVTAVKADYGKNTKITAEAAAGTVTIKTTLDGNLTFEDVELPAGTVADSDKKVLTHTVTGFKK